MLTRHIGVTPADCMHKLMQLHIQPGDNLPMFLDQVRDLAHVGHINDLVVLSMLKSSLTPKYAAILASKMTDAVASGGSLSLQYVYLFLHT